MTRRIFPKALALTALAAAMLAPAVAHAQQGGPAVILTAKSAGELIGDLRYLLSAVAKADDPQIAPALAALDSLKDPAALRGIDPSKPFGAYGSLPEGNNPPSVVVFVPVLDAKAFLGALNENGMTVEEDKSAPGFTHKVTPPGGAVPPLFVTSGGGYVYFSLSPVGADALKAMKPATLLPKRAGAGDISLTVRFDRLPAEIKGQVTGLLEQGMAAQSDKKPGEDEDAYKARLAGAKMFQNAVTTIVRDGKELALDLVIDPKTEFFGLELNSSAVAGSAYATSLRKIGAMKSKFRGLANNAAIGGFVALPVPPAVRELMGKSFDQAKTKALADPKMDAAAKKAFEDVSDSLRATLTAETLDAAVAVQGPTASNGGAGTYAGVMAMTVKGGKKIETLIRQSAKSLPADKRKELVLDSAKAADGTAIHKLVPSEGDFPAAFGTKQVFAAFRDDAIVLAVGKDGQAALNGALKPPAAAMATGAVAAPQIELFVSASRIAGLAEKPAERDAMMAASADVFKGTAAKKDRISLVLRAQGDAVTLRIGGDVPALKFLTLVGQNGQQAN